MNSEIRVLLVDDIGVDRDRLRFLLEGHPGVKIIGEASSASTAATLCLDLQPNLIFLDVDMPGGDGFSLLEMLDPIPTVIFVTAFNEFAVRAFEVNAVDYLLKPVNPVRLKEALRRVVYAAPSAEPGIYQTSDRIFLPSNNRNRVVYVPEISGIRAEQNYTEVLLSDGTKIFMRRAISYWEARLPKSLFFCPHRSLIVNLRAVHDVILENRDDLRFKLEGYETMIDLGRKAGAKLRRALRDMR